MAAWWANSTDQKGAPGFVDQLAKSFGDFSHSQECGIGQACNPPNSPGKQILLSHSIEENINTKFIAFQSSGAPRWAYFVYISLHEMKTLLNDMKVRFPCSVVDIWLPVARTDRNIMQTGLVAAETDLSLIISDMATNFFPGHDPTSDLQRELPLIQAVVSIMLSFIPVIRPLLARDYGGPILGTVAGATQAITQAGFQEFSVTGSDSVLV
jgi:hypothetical protein